jgi:outer membrane receptor protein involved in Fe transport
MKTSLNPLVLNQPPILTIAGFLLIASVPPAAAQVPASPPVAKPTEETLILSPFEVAAERDTGYMASNTLAGSRLSSSLLTTPAAISVFTKDLLADLAASDVMEAARYALNATPMEQNSPSANFEANISSNNAVEFRGFGAGGQARNFFPWSVTSDSYNVERLDFSRGPNSILFGTGTPGGIINVTPKRANLERNRGSLGLRLGSWEAYRATFDYNFVVKKGVLAARINAVWDDGDGYVNHAFTRREGLHGAVTYRPFPNTTLRLDGEKLSQDRNIGRTFPLLDFYSGWNRVTIPTAGGALPANAFGLARIPTNAPAVVFDSNSRAVLNWAGMGQTVTDRGSTLEPTLSRTQNFAGPDDRNDAKVDNYTLLVEQKLFDQLYLEGAYNRLIYGLATNRPLLQGLGASYGVIIDPNERLPGGAPNPNVGQPYTEGNWAKGWQSNDSKDYRLTASYELNFGRWLGRHQFAGLYGRRDDRDRSTSARETDINRVFAPTRPLSDNAHRIFRRHYLKYGDGAENTGLTNIDGVNGIDSEFIAQAANQVRDQILRQDYKQLSLISHFWKGRLTLIGGIREDDFKTRSRDATAQDSRGSFYRTGDFGAWGAPFGKQTRTFGAVFRAVGPLYIYANDSENFNNQSNRVPVIGADGKFTLDPIPPRAGEGRDFGLRYSDPSGRFNASLGYYETNELNRTFFWFGAVNTQSKIIIDRLEPGQWVSNFQDVSNTEGRGFEFEVTANLTSRWRLTANAAKKETELSGQGRFFKTLYQQKKAAWRATGDPIVIDAMNIIEPILTTFVKDGQKRLGEREYTANLVTNYRLDPDGRLKGVSVGGAVRYLGPAIIGYDDANADNIPEIFMGKSDVVLDLNAGYRRKLRDGRSVHFQLNVKNALQNNMVQQVGIVAVAFDQEGGTIIYKRPREIQLSATLDF